jgi:hypothetical protein
VASSGCSICSKVSGWFSSSNTLAGTSASGWFWWIGFLLAVLLFWKFVIAEVESLL